MHRTVTPLTDFPDWDARAVASSTWTRIDHDRWLFPIAEGALPAMATPWVRLIDFSLPGFVETEVPEGWGARVVQWEQELLRHAMRAPPPPSVSPSWPRTATDWKKATRSWCRPSSRMDRWNAVWLAEGPLHVFVGPRCGPKRTACRAEDALVCGQWIALSCSLRGVIWDGQSVGIAFTTDQVLVRQPWCEDVREMAKRALEQARAAALIGPQEEKILSLLDISSR